MIYISGALMGYAAALMLQTIPGSQKNEGTKVSVAIIISVILGGLAM